MLSSKKPMKAILQHAYGVPEKVLEFGEVAKPEPKDDEVLVRVHASSVNISDWFFLIGKPYVIRMAAGLFRPKHKVPGRDVAGTVEAVGAAVTRFKPGDEVFGEMDLGAYAEYAAVPETVLGPKPANLTFEQAAAVPLAGLTALQGLRDSGKIQAGQSVVINGASGGVGHFAVQVAKAFGAEVTAVCSTRNIEMVRSVGADHVSDYTEEDFTESDARYDLIFDLVGSRPLSAYRRVLEPTGRYISCVGNIPLIFATFLRSLFNKQYVVMPSAKATPEDLEALKEMAEAGKLTPVIERTYDLTEVPLALRHHGDGHARGKKVIAIP